MENESTNTILPLIDLLIDQLNILVVVTSRPVVQRQIIVFLLTLTVPWIVIEGLRGWRRRRSARDEKEPIAPADRIWVRLNSSLHPILALGGLYFAIWVFGQLGYPRGLLGEFTTLVWTWLVFRLVTTLITARYRETARPYINRIVRPLFFFLLLLQGFALLPGSVALTDATINLGTVSISIGGLFAALITLYLFFIAAWIISEVMSNTLPQRLGAERGVVESVATLVRYSLMALGVIISLSIFGLDFTSLAIIAGGLSVGIGIGLQDIVSNFVSGLVLLLEQSLKPGDIIEVGNRISRVEQISLRATTVRTRTNEEIIVPNNQFTSQEVKNFTKSDRLVQVVAPIGVSYKSDPELVSRLAKETSLQHELVLKDPPPELVFLGYGESSLDFNLLVSVRSPEKTIQIRSDLYYMLWKVFAENGIEIPFPQRDLNLGTGWDALGPGGVSR